MGAPGLFDVGVPFATGVDVCVRDTVADALAATRGVGVPDWVATAEALGVACVVAARGVDVPDWVATAEVLGVACAVAATVGVATSDVLDDAERASAPLLPMPLPITKTVATDEVSNVFHDLLIGCATPYCLTHGRRCQSASGHET